MSRVLRCPSPPCLFQSRCCKQMPTRHFQPPYLLLSQGGDLISQCLGAVWTGSTPPNVMVKSTTALMMFFGLTELIGSFPGTEQKPWDVGAFWAHKGSGSISACLLLFMIISEVGKSVSLRSHSGFMLPCSPFCSLELPSPKVNLPSACSL